MKNLIASGILALASSVSVAAPNPADLYAPDPADLHPLTSLGTDFYRVAGSKLFEGYTFHVNEPLLVNAIGSAGFDLYGHGHELFLWDSKGTLLHEDTVLSPEQDDPTVYTVAGQYKYASFHTVLPVGDYVIAAWGAGGTILDPNGLSYQETLYVGAKTTSNLITITGAGEAVASNYLKPGIFGQYSPYSAMGYVTLSAVALASVVPEPSTYAMLFAGLALIGGIARRRKQ